MLDWLAAIWPIVDREWDGMQRHEGTLSETLATAFRTETLPGKAAFVATLAAGSIVLGWHIVTFRYSTKAQH